MRLCRRLGTKALLHNSPTAAKRLGAFGVHLSGSMQREIGRAKRSGAFVIASTHSRGEAVRAFKRGADRIVISPIFEVANKGLPLGVSFLQSLNPTIRSKTIALGGIVDEAHARCLSGVFAFASIRFFVRKDNNGV